MEETTANVGKEAVPAEEVQASRQIVRGQLLRTLAASSGVVAASALLPRKWSKPVVEVGLLPAYAQVSPAPTSTPTGTQTPTATPTVTTAPIRCGLPATPTQISPPDDTTFFQAQLVTLVWSTGLIPEACPALTYGIEIQWEEPDFGWKVELEVAGLASPSQMFPLAVPGAYRWRVWATTAAGDGPRTGWWYFRLVFPDSYTGPAASDWLAAVIFWGGSNRHVHIHTESPTCWRNRPQQFEQPAPESHESGPSGDSVNAAG